MEEREGEDAERELKDTTEEVKIQDLRINLALARVHVHKGSVILVQNSQSSMHTKEL